MRRYESLWLRSPFCKARLKAKRLPIPQISEEHLTLGDYLRFKRLENNHFQSDLATLFNVSKETIKNWELNQTEITRMYYPVIEKYLGFLPKQNKLSDIARNLIWYRWKHNITIRKLAKIIKIDASCILNAENGMDNFQKGTRSKILEFISKQIIQI